MILKNADIFDSEFALRRADVRVEAGKIAEIGENLNGGDEHDLSGCVTAVPDAPFLSVVAACPGIHVGVLERYSVEEGRALLRRAAARIAQHPRKIAVRLVEAGFCLRSGQLFEAHARPRGDTCATVHIG